MSVIRLQRGGNAWMGELTRSDRGPYSTPGNALLVMLHDNDLRGLLAYDEFSHRMVVTKAPPAPFGFPEQPGPHPRAASDTDITLIQGYIERVYAMRLGQPVVLQAASAAAEAHRVHPVRDWLSKLRWDGKPRLDTWLHVAFGVPNDAYHQAIGVKFLVAAVRRVRHPGAKFDHVLSLYGRQGKGKSRACEALFGRELFTDNLPDDLGNKDAQQGMAGRWGIELGEMNALIRTENNVSKAFFSRQVDYFRPPYGRGFVERPRQCVFVGTTNMDDFLSDTTGNRRYWPVRCETVEVGWIADNREQLWAEAADLEERGEALWLDTDDLQKLAEAQQLEHTAEDVWAPRVQEWLVEGGRTDVRSADILKDALGVPAAQQTRGAEMRVGGILRMHGWMRHRFRGADGKTVSRWFAPGRELPGRPGFIVPTP